MQPTCISGVRSGARTAILALTAIATSCVAVTGESLGSYGAVSGRDIAAEKAKNPGWADLGLGFGVAFDTEQGQNDDASGLLVTTKAYPAGRWWTTRNPSNEIVYVKERNTWRSVGQVFTSFLYRVFFMAGASAGNFSGGNLDGPVYVVGGGFDIAPQFALVGGVGFFELDDEAPGGGDTDTAPYFGFALSTKAFYDMTNAATNRRKERDGAASERIEAPTDLERRRF